MNRVREIWDGGGQAIAGWLQMSGALHAEALARCGYDALVVDLQHSMTDYAAAIAMIAAIEHGGAEPFVRVQWNDIGDIMKLLDAGAYGVISPMIETPSQARLLASAVHYPPRGARSYGPRRPLLRYGSDYVGRASETIVSFAMIETKTGLDNLESILEVEGIDGIFVGPADLAAALGRPPKPDSNDEIVVDAVTRIRRETHARDKRVGIFCGGASFANAKLAEGFDFVSTTPDLTMLTTAARQVLAETRAGIPS